VGYRSEVVLVVGKEVMPQFMVTMSKCQGARAMCFGDAERHENYDGDGNMLFRWSWIKWYDSDDAVRAIEDFMDWCDGEDVPVSEEQKAADKSPTPVTHRDGDECYKFVRIGDEYDDIETRGCGFYDVGVSREVTF
jgi:hypothetical protein